ncbi:hypothetical protein ACI6PS_01875 [Flavobacterium sp. PLA-1-15]|uniref:hypothetical protein n=1 Tax=Flavobacterium sp. PLA-1-15 TaxID=3380533 RepID=UPI003B7E3560
MKQLLTLIVFIASITYCNAQTILAQKGTFTSATNEKIAFEKIQIIGSDFHYIEPATGEEKKVAIKTVKVVEDENYKRVFTNRSIIVSSEFSSQGIVQEKTLTDTIATARTQLPKKEEVVASENGYPVGIYYTKDDFIRKVPNSRAVIVPKELVGWEKDELTGIPDNCYFYLASEDTRIKKVFAICYKGYIYFQAQAILDNRHKTDRAQTNAFPNGFSKVQIMGENYFYTEVGLVNKWAQGLAYSGGVAGSVMATGMYNQKGIVWDVKNQEFNIFKNCKDYNDFIKDLYPEGVQDCKNHQPDIHKVRQAMEIIK